MKREISLYLIFGVLTTLIGVGGYGIFLTVGMHYFAATTISWILAVLFAFVTNRKFVFESKASTRGQIIREGISFFTSRAGTWLMETAGLVLLIDGLSIDAMISKYIMQVLVIVMNYILSKLYVFKTSETSKENV